jgi:O-antigen/teichoic acid export membrane protein
LFLSKRQKFFGSFFQKRTASLTTAPVAGVRRAFLWASLGRYIVMAINLCATLVMARLLTPAQFGVAVLGGAVLAIAETIRSVGGGAYLVQQRTLTPEDIRTNFTVSLCVTGLLTVCVALLGAPCARYFNTPDLYRYLQVAVFSFMTGPVAYSIQALLSRQMAFGVIAANNVLTTVVSAACGILLAALGFGYMSLAWASAISAIAGMVMYLRVWQDWSIFRPMLGAWRRVVAFGAFDSTAWLLAQIAESLPYFIFGRVLGAASVGLCQRALLLCMVPERVILAGVGAVALPAFSQRIREGSSLRQAYLRAIELITVALWPALLLLALLADPVVALLLGPRWFEIVPLVRVLAVALLFSFPLSLHYPALVAAGAIRFMPLVVLVQGTVSIGIVTLVAPRGLYAAALAMLVVVPMNGMVSLALVRHFVGVSWRDMVAAIRKSAACAALAAAGPAAFVASSDASAHMSIGAAGVGLVAAGAGWAGGLLLTRHTVLHEVTRAAIAARSSSLAGDSSLGRLLVLLSRRAEALVRWSDR